jgi:hypothetical protein
MKSIKDRTILLILSGLFLMIPGILLAQERSWDGDPTGEIEDAEVVIEKDRVVTLSPASRNYEKIPPLPKSKQEASIEPYDFREIDHPWGNLRINPRALRLKNEPLDKLYGGYLKGGIANYLTGYAEGYVFTKRNKNFFTGLHAKHLSASTGPVDKDNSSDGHNVIDWTGKSIAGLVKVGGVVRYQNDRYNFYGYPEGPIPDKDSIRQAFNNVFAQVSLENNSKDLPGDYDLKINYNYLSDKYDAAESQFNINLRGNHTFDEKLSFYVSADAFLSKYQDGDNLNRNLIRIIPSATYDFGDFEVNGGLNVVIQNDTIQSRNQVLLYPVVGVNYHINEAISAYLKIDGDLNNVSYQSLVNENPYLNSRASVLHTNKKFSLDWGIKGSLASLLCFKAGMSQSSQKDMFFFVNDSIDISKFNVIYDHGFVSVTDIYAELLISRTKMYAVGLKGNYFAYKTSDVSEAWHKPSYTMDLIGKYNLKDKIILNADLYMIGGLKAIENNTSIELDNIIDLNLKLEYLFSDRFSAFLSLDNILGKNYQEYYRYPVRGIQVMGGVSISF